jgi:hypothetical protein
VREYGFGAFGREVMLGICMFGSFGAPYRRESCGVNRAWTACELQDDIAGLDVVVAQKYALCDASFLLK